MKARYIVFGVIAILGLGVYAGSIDGQFVWDDDHLIRNNSYIKNWELAGRLFTTEIGAGSGATYNAYRPLQMLTYAVDYSFWKLKVQGYHLTNIVLHIIASLLVYWLIQSLTKDRLVSFLSAVFFIVHPVHSETVMYISNRADLLAAVFILLCFILYVKEDARRSVFYYLLLPLSYGLALLSKENSVIMPAIILLYHYAFRKKIRWVKFLPILGLSILYLILRVTVLSVLPGRSMHPIDIAGRLPGFFIAVSGYIKLLIMPFGLHMEYGKKFFYFTDWRVIIGISLCVILIISAFLSKRKRRLFFFFAGWFFITLLPQSNLYPITAYMAEHWLYLPSIGFFLMLAYAVSYLLKKKNLKLAGMAIVIIIVAFWSYLASKQSEYWKDPTTFYTKTLYYSPDSPAALNNLGSLYKDKGNYKEAIPLLKKAIEMKPDFLEAYNNLGTAYADAGQYKDAFSSYEKAIRINPNFALAYNNMGVLYTHAGEYDEAMRAYKKAVELNPNSDFFYNNLASSYVYLGKYYEAIIAFKKCTMINPDYAPAFMNLAKTYYQMKEYDLAVKYYHKAVRSGCGLEPEFLKAIEGFRKNKKP